MLSFAGAGLRQIMREIERGLSLTLKTQAVPAIVSGFAVISWPLSFRAHRTRLISRCFGTALDGRPGPGWGGRCFPMSSARCARRPIRISLIFATLPPAIGIMTASPIFPTLTRECADGAASKKQVPSLSLR